MKKHIVILCFVVVLGIVGCASQTNNYSQGKKSLMTIDQVATIQNAFIGETNTPYRMNTKYTNDDGSYIFINIQSLKYYSTYTVNNGDSISNVIVMENVLPISETQNLINKVAYIHAFDKYGVEMIIGDIYTQTGQNFSEIIFSAKNISETQNIKFIIIGGLDDETQSKIKMIFEIK